MIGHCHKLIKDPVQTTCLQTLNSAMYIFKLDIEKVWFDHIFVIFVYDLVQMLNLAMTKTLPMIYMCNVFRY